MERNELADHQPASVWLVSERRNRGLSVPAFALEIGIRPHVLRHAEKGGLPSPANALKIAQHHGVKVTDLWPVEQAAA